MRGFRFRFAAVAGGLALAACGTSPDPTGESAGSPFTEALASAYASLAEEAEAERDAAFYRQRRQRAASGEALSPRTLYDLEIPADMVLDLADARIQLVGVLQDAATRQPELAARAQSHFDCWAITVARERPAETRAACRDSFRDAMTELTETDDPAA